MSDPIPGLLKSLAPKPRRPTLVLSPEEHALLHAIIMRMPEGVSELEADDWELPLLDRLRREGLIRKKGYRWHATEDGILHMAPHLAPKKPKPLPGLGG